MAKADAWLGQCSPLLECVLNGQILAKLPLPGALEAALGVDTCSLEFHQWLAPRIEAPAFFWQVH